MKQWIRNYLGVDNLEMHLNELRLEIGRIDLSEIRKLRNQVEPTLIGIGRIIAKLDANYGRSEFDPECIAESNRLGKEAINRLVAENLARHHQFGDE